MQKEIFHAFFLPPFFSRLDTHRVYTGCPFIGRHAMPVRRTFRGYKINLACKTEMERRKRSRNRWRKSGWPTAGVGGGGGGSRREEKKTTPRVDRTILLAPSPAPCSLCLSRPTLSAAPAPSVSFLYARVPSFLSVSPPHPHHRRGSSWTSFFHEAANLMLGACCPRDTVIYDPCSLDLFSLPVLLYVCFEEPRATHSRLYVR